MNNFASRSKVPSLFQYGKSGIFEFSKISFLFLDISIKALFEKDKEDPALKDYSHLLLDIAVIGEGGKVENPSRLSKMIGDLMTRAMGE